MMASSDLSTPKLINAPINTKVLTGGTMAELRDPFAEKLYPYTSLILKYCILNTNTGKAFASFLPMLGR